MDTTSIFDIIGPRMIGPSSSHTAGALRIALLARKLVEGSLSEVRFTLYGSFARTYKGHGTDKALIAGILGYNTDDARIREAPQHLEEQGIQCHFDFDLGDKECHPNTVAIEMVSTEGKKTCVTGISPGGGKAVINSINGAEIRLTGEYSTVFITHRDVPGVITAITGCLSKAGVNIAFMSLFREDKGALAYTVIEFDGGIMPATVMADIRAREHVESALLIEV